MEEEGQRLGPMLDAKWRQETEAWTSDLLLLVLKVKKGLRIKSDSCD